jgi:hypothetical protein
LAREVWTLTEEDADALAALGARATRAFDFPATGVPPAPVAFARIASLPIASLDTPPWASEPDPRFHIVTNDNRVLDAAWEGGELWLSANGACIPAGDTSERACGRVIGVDTGSRRLIQDADIEAAGTDVFFPALRPDANGNVDIVYGYSSSTAMPSVAAVTRTPDGSFSQPLRIATSRSSYIGPRYGDYFGAARDPLDPTVVWVAGEIGSSGPAWRTQIAAVRAGAAPPSPPPPLVDDSAPTVRALASRGRAGKRVRLLYRVTDDSGFASERVTVTRGGRIVFHAATRLAHVDASQTYGVEWQAPRRRLTGYRFCVGASDPTGNAATPSCAAITLR